MAGRAARRGSGRWRGCRSIGATTIRRCSGPIWSPPCGRWHPTSAPGRSALLQSSQAPDRRGPRDAGQRPRRRRPTTWCWCSTTTTSSRRATCTTGMAFLLEHLPPQVHLVIAGRADPALPLARLRARGELVEVRAADLRFTPEEAAAYLNEVMGLTLTAGDVAALEGRTEGWIAALQLAALSMQGRDDVAGFIAGFAGDDRYIVDYLVEEVLQRQPERRPQLPAADLHPEPADRPAVRRGHRPGRRQGHARGARAGQPVPGPARRPAPVVPLPPPVRRRPAGAPAGRAARRASPDLHRRAERLVRARTATGPRPSVTRWPAGTSSARPT